MNTGVPMNTNQQKIVQKMNEFVYYLWRNNKKDNHFQEIMLSNEVLRKTPRKLIIQHNQVPSDHLLSPAEENQPSSNGIGLTAKAELDQKRENGLSASNGGSVRLKFAQGFPKTEAGKKGKYFLLMKHLSAIKSIFIEHLCFDDGFWQNLKPANTSTSFIQ